MLESTYHEAVWIELADRGIAFVSQPFLPVSYKGRKLATYYRPDLIIENLVIVELKAVEWDVENKPLTVRVSVLNGRNRP